MKNPLNYYTLIWQRLRRLRLLRSPLVFLDTWWTSEAQNQCRLQRNGHPGLLPHPVQNQTSLCGCHEWPAVGRRPRAGTNRRPQVKMGSRLRGSSVSCFGSGQGWRNCGHCQRLRGHSHEEQLMRVTTSGRVTNVIFPLLKMFWYELQVLNSTNLVPHCVYRWRCSTKYPIISNWHSTHIWKGYKFSWTFRQGTSNFLPLEKCIVRMLDFRWRCQYRRLGLNFWVG